MKKYIIKSTIFCLILGFTLVGVFYLVKATRSGPDNLTASPGDKLTATQRNLMSNKLKVYDSGRFNVGTTAGAGGATTDGIWNTYAINHNLGTTNILVDVYYRLNSSSTDYEKPNLYYQFNDGGRYCIGYYIQNINDTSLKIKTRYSGCSYNRINGMYNGQTSGQYRVIVKAF